MYFDVWNNPYRFKYNTKDCHVCSGSEVYDAIMEAKRRKLKQLQEKLKRLNNQLMATNNPAYKNSLMSRIEQVQAEIAILERDLKT